MPPVGFEPTISAGERPQTYALDCTGRITILYIPSLSFLYVVRDFLMGNGESVPCLLTIVFSTCFPFPLVDYVFRQTN